MSEAVAKSDLYCVCCVYGVSSSKQTADSHSQDAATTVAAEDAMKISDSLDDSCSELQLHVIKMIMMQAITVIDEITR